MPEVKRQDHQLTIIDVIDHSVCADPDAVLSVAALQLCDAIGSGIVAHGADSSDDQPADTADPACGGLSLPRVYRWSNSVVGT